MPVASRFSAMWRVKSLASAVNIRSASVNAWEAYAPIAMIPICGDETEERIVVTKDADFVTSHIVFGSIAVSRMMLPIAVDIKDGSGFHRPRPDPSHRKREGC